MPRLLLVEDDESNRLTLSALLEDEGFAVDEAAGLGEARARLAVLSQPYDFALLDQHLGDGLGSELVPLLRAAHPTTKIVSMSGSARADEALSPAVDARFEKGGSFARLLALLR